MDECKVRRYLLRAVQLDRVWTQQSAIVVVKLARLLVVNNKSNRYLALDEAIQRGGGGRGRDGQRKKLILLSATPMNNDLYDLANQINLFTQRKADYIRDAGIGDVNVYFRRARRLARADGAPPGLVLFNLLEEIMVRNRRG